MASNNGDLPVISEGVASPTAPTITIQEDARGRDHTVHNAPNLSGEENTQPRRRGSLAALADRIRSRSRSKTRNRESLDLERTSTNSSSRSRSSSRTRKEGEYVYSSRKSSEISGPYADVARAQAEFMDNLREQQQLDGVYVNADGIPIPPPPERTRRSSVSKALGLEKPLLSL